MNMEVWLKQHLMKATTMLVSIDKLWLLGPTYAHMQLFNYRFVKRDKLYIVANLFISNGLSTSVMVWVLLQWV